MTALTGATLACVFGLSGCQEKKNLTVVVPFAPGGGGDVLARIVLQPLSEEISRSVIILNRPGAGGNVGTRAVIRAAKGEGQFGYVTNGIMCVNKHLYKTQKFDPSAELLPVAAFTKMPLVLALNPKANSSIHDFQSLVAYARNYPKKLAFASSGVGTTSHIAGELFAQTLALEINHIPHAGGAAAANEVLAGRIPFFIDVMPNVLPHAASGKLSALAVTSAERSSLLPAVPSLNELGLDGYNLYAWDGLAASRNIAPEFINAVHDAIGRILSRNDVRARLARLGAEPMLMSKEEFSQFIKSEGPRWESYVKSFTSRNASESTR